MADAKVPRPMADLLDGMADRAAQWMRSASSEDIDRVGGTIMHALKDDDPTAGAVGLFAIVGWAVACRKWGNPKSDPLDPPEPQKSLPTEAGFYWWRQNSADRWQFVRVVAEQYVTASFALSVKTEDGHASPLDNRWDGQWAGPLREPS